MRGQAGTSASVGSQAPFFSDRRPYSDQWQTVKRYLWSPEKRTVCNRTGLNWVQLIIFYLCFLIFVFGLTIGILYGITVYITDNFHKPIIDKRTLVEHESPGMGFAPRLRKGGAPLIWYTLKGTQSATNMKPPIYVKAITNYLKEFKTPGGKAGERYVDCSLGKQKGKFCSFNISSLGPCAEKDYGYPEKQPCIYLKVNRLDGWKPVPYDLKNVTQRNRIPKDLLKVIEGSPDKEYLWLRCTGWRSFDDQHIGKIQYYPTQGFPSYFFPYMGRKGYISPLVAIKLDEVKPGYFITITCQLYAGNIGVTIHDTFHMTINLYIALDL